MRSTPGACAPSREECFDAGRRAGYTTVGEFHYVHHRPDGTPYEEPNELALAVIDAARAVGIRIVLLLAAYARGGAGSGPSPGQRRFCDRSVEAYLGRVERLAAAVEGDPLVSVGYAPHSLRAVPREWLVTIAGHAARTGYPLHIHAGEQPREVTGVAGGVRPAADRAPRRLRRARPGARPSCTRRTSPTDELDLLAQTGSTVCACPTHRGQSRRRLPARRGALGARRPRLVRRRLQRAPRPVRGGARDRGLRAPPERPAQRARGRHGRRPGAVAVALSHEPRRAQPRPCRRRASSPARPPIWSRSTWRIPRSARVEPEHLPAAVLFSGTAALVRETWVAGAAGVSRASVARTGLAIGRTALSCVRRCGSAMLRSALVAAAGREPAGRDACASVGAGRAGLAAGAAEAREPDDDRRARRRPSRPAGRPNRPGRCRGRPWARPRRACSPVS